MEKTLSLCRLAGITGTGGLFAFGQHILAVADARLLCGKDVGVKRPALLLLPVVRVIVPPQEKVTLVRALRAAFSVRPGIDSGEQQEIINAHPEGCGFWAQLFSYTGLRMGEANGLQWKDVDFDAGVIHVNSAMPWDRNRPYEETLKTENAYRDVPILTPLRPLLLQQKKGHRGTDYVMSGESKPLSQSQYEWRWAAYCRDLGLSVRQEKRSKVKGQPGKVRTYYKWKALVTAHQFRHCYATNLFYAGVPDKIAQKLMGHADIMTTRRIYQELRDAENREYIDRLDAYVQKHKRG